MSYQESDAVGKTMPYRVLLMTLDSELGSEDCHKLKFLVGDVGVPKSKLDQVKQAADIFDELERKSLITPQDVGLLRELMQLIHRRDLLKVIDAYSFQNNLYPKNGNDINAYRSLLLEVADNISTKEFEDLKRACTDNLPRQTISKLANVYQMFTALEEHDLLTPGKLGFLRNLVHLVGNTQMAQRLQQDAPGCPSEVDLSELSFEVGPNWQKLGTHLGFRYNSLQAIDADLHKTHDKALYMLMEWKQRLPHTADGYAQLSRALQQCGRVDLAHRVARMSRTSSGPGQQQSSSQLPQSGLVSQPPPQAKPRLMKPSDFQKAAPAPEPLPTRMGSQPQCPADDRGLPDVVLLKLSEMIPYDWKQVATHLGISYLKIQALDQDNRQSQDKALAMLWKWRNGLSASANATAELASAFKNVERMDVVATLAQECENIEAQVEPSKKDLPPEPMDTQIGIQEEEPQIQAPSAHQPSKDPLQCTPNLAQDEGSGQLKSDRMPVQEVSLDEYKMDRNPRGMCLIINNDNFAPGNPLGLQNRPGSEVDAGRLDNLFQKLHFKVKVENSLKAEEMKISLNEVSHLDHSEYDCFVCCVLSHGTMGLVYGSDAKPMEIQDILHPFKPLSCDSLKGKPKLFFIQACQGTNRQGTVQLETDDPGGPRGMGAGMTQHLPNEADFLLGQSTVPGYLSTRSRTKGSWFMNALVEEMTLHHNSLNLNNILIKVNEAVSEKANGIVAQVPMLTETLRKEVVLRTLNT